MADEISQATWTTRKERSKQYYVLRTDYSWSFHTNDGHKAVKLRDPLDAVRKAWGNLDVVDLLALSPQPVKRGWQRFEEPREIVDVGRNKQLADEKMAWLRRQVNDYKRTIDTADPRHVEKIKENYTLDGRRKRWIEHASTLIKHPDTDIFARFAYIDWGQELVCEMVELNPMEREQLGKDDGHLLDKLLARAQKRLEAEQRTFALDPAYYQKHVNIAAQILKQNSFHDAFSVVKTQREALQAIFLARADMLRYYSYPGTFGDLSVDVPFGEADE